MSAPLPSLSVDLSSTIDGLYWGVVISTALFGITIVQAWIYVNNNSDKWPLRLLVAVLIAADFATTVLNNIVIHEYLVVHFGDLENLLFITPSVDAEFLITIIIVYLVQLFFAARVRLLRKGAYWVSGAIIFFATIGLASGIYTIARQFQNNALTGLNTPSERISVGIDQASTAISDVITTVALTWNLASARSEIRRTNTVLQKLLIYIVSRGLLVSLVTVAFLIMFLVHPDNLYWMPLHLSLSKIYVITMVAMLNGRQILRTHLGNVVVSDSARNPSLTEPSFRSGRRTALKTTNTSHIELSPFATVARSVSSYDGSKAPELDADKKAAGVLVSREQLTFGDSHFAADSQV